MRDAIEKEPGIKQIEIDWNIRQVKVIYEEAAIDAERLAAVVQELYPVQVKNDKAYAGKL